MCLCRDLPGLHWLYTHDVQKNFETDLLDENTVWNIRAFIYHQHFAETTHLRVVDEVASCLALHHGEVASAYEALHQRHEPD